MNEPNEEKKMSPVYITTKIIFMIIGIGGISRAGKTSLCKILRKEFRYKTAEVHLDDYIKESSHWDFFMKFPVFYLCKLHKSFNMEHPDTIDFDRMYADIISTSLENDIIIAEGSYVNYDTRIRGVLDCYIHVSLSREVFTQRRMKDFKQTNRWYANHLWNSFMKYGTYYSDLKHMVIDGDTEIDTEAVLKFINISQDSSLVSSL